MKKLLLLIPLLFIGCATLPEQGEPDVIASIAKLSVDFIKDPAVRKTVGSSLYPLATGIRALSGTTPTAEQLRNVVDQYAPSLSESVSDFGPLFVNYVINHMPPQISGAKAYAAQIELVAEGLEKGAALILSENQ